MRVFFYIFILGVAFYDCYWCVTIPYDSFINEHEKNPLVIFLVKNVGMKPFISIKIFNTLLCVGICEYLARRKYKFWKTIVAFLTLFQFFLLSYLEFGYVYQLGKVRSLGDLVWKIYTEALKNY